MAFCASVNIFDISTQPSLSVSDVSVQEGDAGTIDAMFTVRLSAATGRTIGVNFTSAGLEATSGADFQSVSGTLTFNPGVISQTVIVPVFGDLLDESNERFAVNLSDPSGAIVADNQGVGTILDNDPPPTVSITDVKVSEGSTGTVNAVLTVSLSAASGRTVTVDFSTANGTATAGGDYTATSGRLTFNPAETVKTISVPVLGDILNEADENFFVNLINSNATISDPQGVVTILNDDTPALQFNSSGYVAGEGAGKIIVTVLRTGDVSSAARVNYSTRPDATFFKCDVINGAASERCDYTTTAGVLRFAAGETQKTFVVPIVDDAFVEGDETINLTLSNQTGTTLGAASAATLTIQDNDTMPPTGANNPFLGNAFFVRQQYLDFLNREPDTGGFNDWLNVLNGCGPAQGGLGSPVGCDKVHVSSGFYRSAEFTDRGYFIFRFYDGVLGRLPKYAEFVPDMAGLSGFQTGQEQEQNIADFIAAFMQRSEFTDRYAGLTTAANAAQFITKLEQTAGVMLPETIGAAKPNQPPQFTRTQLIAKMGSGELTPQQTLKAFVEQQVIYDRFFFRGFVAMQYFGYMRRDPDMAGYNDWVDVLTNGRGQIQKGNYRHLIFGFLYAEEYRARFGQP